MNLPNPAIVAERGAQRLPRWALLAFCAAYVMPGLFGRDPWRNADLSAFGFMASIASGHASWWQPAIAGIPADGAPLPYWIGALAIKAMPFFDAAFAARLPYALVLVLVLVLTWYSSFHLACTEAAQPVAFAFGGEAHSIDYARALADGALLALIASLGLLRLGHETTPELLQLLSITLYLYGLAAAPFRAAKSRWALIAALPMLAASGAPAVSLALTLLGAVLCRRSSYEEVRKVAWWLLASGLLSAASAWAFKAWAWRVNVSDGTALPVEMLSLLGWFCWPAWPLALWTVWRWRQHWQRRHILVPSVIVLVPIATSLLMNAQDAALLLTLPPMAVLAAFALPTLRRGIAAAVDWYSVFFFSGCAIFVWLYYVSMQLGWPAQPLANVRRLYVGFEPSFNPFALVLALAATAAWLALVRWRTARNRHAFWKSLAMAAGGVALCWLLAMTLWLPIANYVRSNGPLVERLRPYLPPQGAAECVAAPGQALSTLAALEFQGHWRMQANEPLARSTCRYAVQSGLTTVPEGWEQIATVRRPSDRVQSWVVLRRR